MTTLPFGDRAFVRADQDPLGLARALRHRFPGADVRAGLDRVLVAFPTPADVPPDAEAVIAATGPDPARAVAGRAHLLEVEYSGPDLAEVARLLGTTPAAVVGLHTGTRWRVAMLGFAPGFPYLVPDDGSTAFAAVARLASPRTAVPAGAVGVAAGMSCVYPSVLPGGWRLLGTTDVVLFDPDREHPAALEPGDTVRFTEAAS